MKNIRKAIAAVTMMMVLMVGTSFAGIYMSDAQETQPCPAETGTKGGVILSDATGILINGFTGILINGFTGILINGATGILINGSRSECR
ncbi:MAG: hypothetical protein M3384_08830 [Acidobacteriota bacterium]|nr:hypothetical protein [Acidobacteriota bacterium]